MKFEIDLIAEDVEQARESGATGSWPDTVSVRRGLRGITDQALTEGLRLNKWVPLIEGMCLTMLTTAKTARCYSCTPDVPDFIEATHALIENARAVIDKGLTVNSEETVKCGIVMMEMSVRGMFTVLGFTEDRYRAMVTAVRDGGDIEALMTEWGYMKKEKSDEG